MSELPNSVHAIGMLLGAGGWTDHLSHVVRRWWRKNRMRTESEKRLEKNKRAFQAMVREKLDDRDRVVLGRYMGLMCKENFDAGLTIGLMCRLTEHEEGQAESQEAPRRRKAKVNERS